MRVGVCDYPSRYAFPPHGYGGIERWLWAVAAGARRAGANVHLIGPAWRVDLPPDYGRLPLRLEDMCPSEAGFDALKRLELDLLVVGHEYPSLPAWRRTWSALDCPVVTFQHDPNFRHLPEAFDGAQSRLFCYSPEMVGHYAAHRPMQTPLRSNKVKPLPSGTPASTVNRASASSPSAGTSISTTERPLATCSGGARHATGGDQRGSAAVRVRSRECPGPTGLAGAFVGGIRAGRAGRS